MFILDALFMSGFRWVLNTVVSAAEAEMNDDSALRDQLLAAEMRRETGEISDEAFADIEADLLARIREIKTRRQGGAGPIAFGAAVGTSPDTQFAVEATISGDFHEPASEPVPFAAEPITAGDRSGTVIEGTVVEPARRRRRVPKHGTPRPASEHEAPRPASEHGTPRRTSDGATPRRAFEGSRGRRAPEPDGREASGSSGRRLSPATEPGNRRMSAAAARRPSRRRRR